MALMVEVLAAAGFADEASMLIEFWREVHAGADRRELLQHMTHVSIARPPEWDRAAIRHEHETSVARVGLNGLTRACFACLTMDRRVYVHHVIEIQHGGSNHPRNRVSLCFRCHHDLHPWLVEPADRHQGWESLADIGRRAPTWTPK